MVWARSGLAGLCLLLVASIAMRLYAYGHLSKAAGNAIWEASGGPVDLGGSILLPRATAQHRTLVLGSCSTPISIDFVEANPYQSDPSLVGAPRPDDHVFYVYRGWQLGSRFATAGLNAIYFARRAYARVSMQPGPAFDDLAVKIIVPAECGASPDAVMATLRRDAQTSQ